MKLREFIIIIFLMQVPLGVLPQETQQPIVLVATVVGGDTILQAQLSSVTIYSTRKFKSPWDQKRYEKLVRNVQKVYPYARLAGLKLREYESVLKAAPSDRERKKIMKQAEKELTDKFGPELKKLNFSQGKILIKLIDRETGNSSYTLLQELRGKFTAFIWQQLARIFGYNLKINYDPLGEDYQIEEIVQRIEAGGFK
ncbi:MAG: DUF4294 domain-containing protein [Bacteroidetes bacterium HGW-Bacteroidetes-22]|nr:MAG: DUF4294 domain-containing protein [Bacteroidetes bacterium HGW-Bacteroidetes-22]